jgi:hypothetical protein
MFPEYRTRYLFGQQKYIKLFCEGSLSVKKRINPGQDPPGKFCCPVVLIRLKKMPL